MRFCRNEKGFTGLEAAIVLIAFVTVAAVFSYVMLGAGFFTTQKSKQVVHTGVTEASSSLSLDGQYIYLTANKTGSNGDVRMVDFYITLTAGKTDVDLNKITLGYKDEDDFVQIPFTKFIIVGDIKTAGCNNYADDKKSNYYAVFGFNGSIPKVTFYNWTNSSEKCDFEMVSYDKTDDNGKVELTISNKGFLPFWYYKPIVANDPKNLVKSGEKYQIFVDLLAMVATMDSSDKYYFDPGSNKTYLITVDTISYTILDVKELNTTSYTDGQIGSLPKTNEDITIELKPSVGVPLSIDREIPPSLKNVTYV
ncbi:MAG: archaellin/type IV pilin N-terminal domain-containing protein [Archaeoglobaceae archaeon]